jgi:hypothetical protein
MKSVMNVPANGLRQTDRQTDRQTTLLIWRITLYITNSNRGTFSQQSQFITTNWQLLNFLFVSQFFSQDWMGSIRDVHSSGYYSHMLLSAWDCGRFWGIPQAFDKAWHTGLLYKLSHFTQILSSQQTLSSEIWIWVHRTLPGQSWCAPGQCPGATVIPATLGLHLDRRLTWRKHIFTTRKQLGMTLTKMYCLLGWKSKLSTSNKILILKAILEPIWTYGIQLWATASNSNIEILERLQSRVLCKIEEAPWYGRNTVIQTDLQTPTVREEIRHLVRPLAYTQTTQ